MLAEVHSAGFAHAFTSLQYNNDFARSMNMTGPKASVVSNNITEGPKRQLKTDNQWEK